MKLLSRLAGALTSVHRGRISFEEIAELVGRDDAVILEVGANDGTDTLTFAQTFPKARIHAFEPDPRAASRFRDKVDAPNVTLHELAISNTNGTLTFHQSDGAVDGGPDGGWDLSGSLRAPKQHLERHPGITFDNTIEVQASTLDSWCEQTGIDRIDFLWADVQGAEADLIRGATGILPATRFFYTEYDNREMYEGQWDLQTIASHLPAHSLRKRWKNDALFELKP